MVYLGHSVIENRNGLIVKESLLSKTKLSILSLCQDPKELNTKVRFYLIFLAALSNGQY